MNHPLKEIISSLNKQADLLSKARNAYLTREAERKHFESTLIQSSPGKSHAERVINAQATKEWVAFHKDLARLQAVFEFQKLKWDVLDREFLAQHLALKLDDLSVKRNIE